MSDNSDTVRRFISPTHNIYVQSLCTSYYYFFYIALEYLNKNNDDSTEIKKSRRLCWARTGNAMPITAITPYFYFRRTWPNDPETLSHTIHCLKWNYNQVWSQYDYPLPTLTPWPWPILFSLWLLLSMNDISYIPNFVATSLYLCKWHPKNQKSGLMSNFNACDRRLWS